MLFFLKFCMTSGDVTYCRTHIIQKVVLWQMFYLLKIQYIFNANCFTSYKHCLGLFLQFKHERKQIGLTRLCFQVVFLIKGPIYLVCISCTEEPYESLRGQLELLYGQVYLLSPEKTFISGYVLLYGCKLSLWPFLLLVIFYIISSVLYSNCHSATNLTDCDVNADDTYFN